VHQTIGRQDEGKAAHYRTRLLEAADLPQVEELLLALDGHDRQARFHLAVSDWWIGAYVGGLDPVRMILVGAFAGRRLVGLAEAHLAASAPVAEMAVVVHPSHRRGGLATRLVRLALNFAFTRGVGTAEFAFGRDNSALIGFVDALGATVSAVQGHAVIQREAYSEGWRRAA